MKMDLTMVNSRCRYAAMEVLRSSFIELVMKLARKVRNPKRSSK